MTNNEIVVISAVWCPSCLILKKSINRLKKEYPNVLVKTLDYDFDEDDVKGYNVGDKLPIIIYNNHKLIGEKSYEEIIEFLKEEGML